jgi:hypothetical protein
MLASVRSAIVLTIVFGLMTPALGQGGAHQQPSQVPRYTPSTPTVSPYVSLLNRNGGAATNYYGLIRPLQRQASINTSQAQTAGRQEQQLISVEEQQEAFEQPKVKPTGTAGWFQNMGTTSPFQVSSHYYGQWQSAKTKKKTGR